MILCKITDCFYTNWELQDTLKTRQHKQPKRTYHKRNYISWRCVEPTFTECTGVALFRRKLNINGLKSDNKKKHFKFKKKTKKKHVRAFDLEKISCYLKLLLHLLPRGTNSPARNP